MCSWGGGKSILSSVLPDITEFTNGESFNRKILLTSDLYYKVFLVFLCSINSGRYIKKSSLSFLLNDHVLSYGEHLSKFNMYRLQLSGVTVQGLKS